MTRIIRWNPYREMNHMINAMDRRVDSRDLPAGAFNRGHNLALDIAEGENEFLVQASLPGMNPDDLEITLESNVLTIKGEYKEETETEDRRYYVRERRSGSVCRSISLPKSVNAESIDADYDAGVLTLHLPKLEEAKPQRIEVKNVEKLPSGK